ncbi:MAG: hypothetical protein AAFA34_00130 [Thermoplasmata archaeon]|jgi:hypothetical protein
MGTTPPTCSVYSLPSLQGRDPRRAADGNGRTGGVWVLMHKRIMILAGIGLRPPGRKPMLAFPLGADQGPGN